MVEETWRGNHARGIMEEQSWRRHHGGAIMVEEACKSNHGCASMAEESWSRMSGESWKSNHGGDHGCAIMSEESWSRMSGKSWKSSHGRGTMEEQSWRKIREKRSWRRHAESMWKHLADIWEASGRHLGVMCLFCEMFLRVGVIKYSNYL